MSEAIETANHLAGGGVGAAFVFIVHAFVRHYRPAKSPATNSTVDGLKAELSAQLDALTSVTQSGIADLKAEQRVQAAALAQQRLDLVAVKERADKALDAHRELLARHQDEIVRLKTILELHIFKEK